MFKEAPPRHGIEIVADETFNPGDTDMTTQLTKIKNSDAQAVVMWTAGKEAAIIAKNAKDLGIDLPIYGATATPARSSSTAPATAAEGVKFATGKVLVPASYGKDSEADEVANDFSALRADVRREAGHLRRATPTTP